MSAPILDFVPGPRGLLLLALTRLTGRCTGRALAMQAGVPTATSARILADLVEAGLVEASPAGRATLYCLNREHLGARALSQLAGLRFELVTTMRERIALWDPSPVAGWLFGSTARGDGNRDSDIDLLFVAPDGCDAAQWRLQLGSLADDVERWTGNQVQMIDHTVSSFLTLDAGRAPLTHALRVEGIELVDACWPAIALAATA